jgi:hypothetical protein
MKRGVARYSSLKERLLSRYRFELATREDDAELRRLMANNTMPGNVSLSFHREPSFFDAAAIEGPFHQTVICRDNNNNAIVGLGSRSIRNRYVDGQIEPIGYLSSLRLNSDHRSMGLVARGFRYFRELDRDERTKLYVTTIAEGNKPAERTLLNSRAGLPTYRRIGTLLTLSLSLRRCESVTAARIEVRNAQVDDLPSIVSFANKVGARKNLFPQYVENDFLGETGTFRRLELSRLFIALEAGKVVGMVGLWDQSGFKQTIVNGYSQWLKLSRPFVNRWFHWRGDPPLPAPGQELRAYVGTLMVVVDDRIDVAKALIAAACVSNRGDIGRLLLGFDSRCSIGKVLASRASHRYTTAIYLVSWETEQFDRWDNGRGIYMELGCL